MKRWQKRLAVALQSPAAQEWIKRQNGEQQAFTTACCHADKIPVECRNWGDMTWVTDTRMSKAQVAAIESMYGPRIWGVVQSNASKACAIVLRYEDTWILVFEDGSRTMGVVPEFPRVWPQRLKRADAPQPVRAKVYNGTYTINRYA